MGKNHYSGGSQLLHKGSPLFQKSNILDLPKTARRNTVKNYLNDIQDIFSNIKILLDSESSIRKDVFQGKLYHWVLVIFTILRKRQSRLRHVPNLENVVITNLINLGVSERLITRVQKKVKFSN
tara:strand:- start:47 stop:418 length:372 start_codon:yes stop_codon:yes gene_type:complete